MISNQLQLQYRISAAKHVISNQLQLQYRISAAKHVISNQLQLQYRISAAKHVISNQLQLQYRISAAKHVISNQLQLQYRISAAKRVISNQLQLQYRLSVAKHAKFRIVESNNIHEEISIANFFCLYTGFLASNRHLYASILPSPLPFRSICLSVCIIPKLYIRSGIGFTKGLSLDLDLKSRLLSLNHAKSVVLDLADLQSSNSKL